MNKAFVLLVLTVLLFSGCKDKPTPPEELPPGYQQDIPWPSLADSPWPMYHSDPQNTGRSKYSGPMTGNLITKITSGSMTSIPVLGEEDILFYMSEYEGLGAVKNYHDIIWKSQITNNTYSFTSPIADSNNDVYFLTFIDLQKYNSKGDLLWKYNVYSTPQGYSHNTASLTMDKENNIYFINCDSLIVVSKDGQLKWKYIDNRLMKRPYHVPAFSPDGNTVYLQGESVSLIAVSTITHKPIWFFGYRSLRSAPVVDCDGNIYIIPSDKSSQMLMLYSLDPSGIVKWEKKLYSRYGNTSEEPCIDKFGNIAVGLDDTLYSFNTNGILNWKKSLSPFSVTTSLTCDKDGNIFFGTADGIDFREMAVSRSGEKLWELKLDDAMYPAILNSDKKLIVPNWKGDFIHIIGE